MRETHKQTVRSTVILSAAKDLVSSDKADTMRQFFVYILFNHSRTLYAGITNDLIRRIDEHRSGKVKGFTAKYKINQLAYYEAHSDPRSAIEREKQIKGRTRAKKVALIESMNPHWQDLSNNLKPRDEVGVARGPLGEGPDFVVRSEILRCAQDDGLAPSESRGTRPL